MASLNGAPLRALFAVAAIVVGIVAVRANASRIPVLLDWVQAQGVLAPVAYAALYAVAVPLLVPGSLLTLTGGALFGLWPGVLVVFGGAVAGSSLSFVAARHVARPWVESWVRGNSRFAAVDRAVEAEGARLVLLLRLTPLIPFNVLNYLLGLTRLRWRDLMLASPGMLPGTFLYVYYGHVIGDVAATAAGVRPPRSAAQYALLAAGLVAAVAVAWRVSVVARRALEASRLDRPPEP